MGKTLKQSFQDGELEIGQQMFLVPDNGTTKCEKCGTPNLNSGDDITITEIRAEGVVVFDCKETKYCGCCGHRMNAGWIFFEGLNIPPEIQEVIDNPWCGLTPVEPKDSPTE